MQSKSRATLIDDECQKRQKRSIRHDFYSCRKTVEFKCFPTVNTRYLCEFVFIKHKMENEFVISAYYKGLSGDVKERYEEKIRKCGCDPYAIKKKELSVRPSDFPEITILDIGEYLVHSISSFTKKKFSAYKSTEAYKHFESGFVLSIGSKKYKEYAILKGRVKHGQKMNESPLHVWVLANMNGKINCSHCTCIAGLSETCSHVGAICYAISSLWESSETKSVTDFLCKWNVPCFKDESMPFVSNIRFRSNSFEKPKLESSFVKYCNSLTPFSDESIEKFIKDCHSDGNTTAMGSILFPEQRRNTSIKDEMFLASLYSDSNQERTRRELIDIGKSIAIELSSDDVNEISCLTLPRLKSKCRFGLKRGRIIASNFKDCCVASIGNPSISFINRMMNPMNNFDFYPRNLTKKKKKALEQYFRSRILHHQELERYDCGLLINPMLPYFAASPDSLIACDCHGEGCIVIKFLKIMESAESFEVLTQAPSHILKKNGNDYSVEKTHDFYYQLQLQINVAELRYCDLIIWSPKPNLGHLILRVNADIDFWRIHMKQAQNFHEQIMMPEILGKCFTRTGCLRQENNNMIVKELESSREDDNVVANEISSCSQYKAETEKVTSLTKDSKTKNVDRSQNHDQFTKISHINLKNLMNDSIEDILITFFDHEDLLKRLYDENIKQLKRNYKPKDIPDMIALDIVNEHQFQAMVNFAEMKLSHDLEEEHNSGDVLFDAIIPEWALAAFGRKFNYTKAEAIKTLKLQSQALIDESEI